MHGLFILTAVQCGASVCMQCSTSIMQAAACGWVHELLFSIQDRVPVCVHLATPTEK